jgi:uncharacterized protein (TIGR03067 family)
MRYVSIPVLLACVMASTAADDAKQKAVAKDVKLLEGAWKVTSIVQGGKEQAEDVLGETMTFKDGKLTVRGNQDGDEPVVELFRLDPTCDPKVIDFDDVGRGFKDAESVAEGVYKIDGDTLTLCIHWEEGRGAAKANRPVALESKEGSKARLITLKRQK